MSAHEDQVLGDVANCISINLSLLVQAPEAEHTWQKRSPE
jgi:hypothetical protein